MICGMVDWVLGGGIGDMAGFLKFDVDVVGGIFEGFGL